jgi:hypothetical protein
MARMIECDVLETSKEDNAILMAFINISFWL